MHKNLLDQTIMGLYQNERPTHDIYRPATCNTWEFINSIPLPKRSSSNVVGFQDPLGLPLRMPTKQDPLSDRMVVGVPNCLIAYWSATTAFSKVA